MSYGLRYFFSFYADRDTRIVAGVPDEYTVNILDLDYVGTSEQIQAVEFPVTINCAPVSDDKTQPIKSSSVDLNLIATADFQLQELYTENERRWLVQVFRNGSKIWQGFIIPDGCQQSFTYPPYTISTNCVDTLGLLKNLSYVQNDGNFWLGKQTFVEVIYNCLNRVQIPDINLYTCVNVTEESYPATDSDDPLAQTYVNAETYLKEDNINPLDCQEVLEKVLRLWGAIIIQSEGDWYVFRPNELALSDTLIFRKYEDGQPAYSGFTVSKNLAQLLGGYSEGSVLAPLFHFNEDQTTVIQKPYKNASMAFKYGAVSSLLVNPNFNGWDNTNFPDWVKSTGLLPLSEDFAGGAKLGNIGISPGPYEYISNSTPAEITINDRIVFNMGYYNYISDGPRARIDLTDGVSTYYLNIFGVWDINETFIDGLLLQYYEGSLSVTADSAPITGDLTVRLYEARDDFGISPSTDLFITYRSANIKPLDIEGDPIGEIHTATQTGEFSFVPETITVLNGDSASQLYLSSMYETDQVTLTSNWYRKYAGESVLASPFASYKPLLRLAVEEMQRIYALPFISYEGTIFGYFNPLSVFRINLLDGKFLPVSLSYNLQANTCKAVLTRIANAEIAMDYTLEPDYGDTTKVTVK